MIYYLPTIYSNREGFDQLAELAHATNDLFLDRLELSFSNVRFFDANMAAPLGAILARVADDINAIEIVDVPPAIEKILRKNLFLTHYRYEPLGDSNRTTMPFRRLKLSDQSYFENYVDRELRGKGIPRMSEGLGRMFKKKIFEVYQNSVIHSESNLGIFVCGQFFPQKQKLDITISDAGIGIRETVRRYLKAKISSMGAIRWALLEGNTTKSGAQPGGLGLKFLHDFIRLNKGRIQIASRFGFYEYCNGEEKFTKLGNDMPGTSVTIEINTGDTAAYCLSEEITPDDVF